MQVNTGRLIGIILIVTGFIVAVLAGLWLAVQTAELQPGGLVLGAGLAFIPVALLVGFGIFLYVRGGREAELETTMQQQRRLLDILKSRGQVGVNEMALELGLSVDTVRDLVHQLVGLQVFSGYVNWRDGTLYSSDASKLRELERCKNCNGEIVLAGKGVVTCKYCGTEYFLT
ncbi:MAG: hypothetical protein BroJett033_7600 [Chloroflexota bacterium]|nr:MAG: hypothetical protein BroJett033_7600 [Chloroflexota bacterium]